MRSTVLSQRAKPSQFVSVSLHIVQLGQFDQDLLAFDSVKCHRLRLERR